MQFYDCIIVGAGPAGLSAALILGRCQRKTLVCDVGNPRNAASPALHGFLTRDGTPPLEMLRIGREQLQPYSTIELVDSEAKHAERVAERFEVTLSDGRRLSSRKLLLATGVVDDIPALNGIEPLYGHSVWHCPYCHGWEARDQPLAVYGRGADGKEFALELTVWSRDLILCTDGPSGLSSADLERLTQQRIPVREERIERLEGSNGQLERIVFSNGEPIARSGLFFTTGSRQRCDLAEKLGCEFTEKGAVNTGAYESTCISGLYVAGDASRAVQLAIIAAAEGAQAAFAINTALWKEDLL